MTTGFQTFDRTTGEVRDCTPDELFETATLIDPDLTRRRAEQAEKVRRDCRITQLVWGMVTEGWDRRTATAIATEFAKAGA